ncbi:MAG: response regulator [Bacteroidaceae bacterium]|nr:response regulator [Bacteroidaceae bacterium]
MAIPLPSTRHLYFFPAAIKLRFLLALCMTVSVLCARADSYRFQHIDSRRGLPHQQVEALAQDSAGYLWIGTRNGLSRFDGYALHTYYHTASPASLRHNLVHALHVDRRHRLWAATETGICRYRPESDDFRCYDTPSGLFWSIAEGADGRLFFGGAALCLYDEPRDTLLVLPSMADDFTVAMAVDGRGQLYAATNSELLRYDTTLSHITRLPRELYEDFMGDTGGAAPLTIAPLTIDSQGRLWMGRNGQGVQCLDLQGDAPRRVSVEDITGGVVRCITEDAWHRIWLGTENGIAVLHPDGHRDIIRHRLQDAGSLSDNAIYAILSDADQNVWVGSYFGGVDCLIATGQQFLHFEPSAEPGELQARVPRMMVEEPSGHIWVATEDNGIHIFDPASSRFTPFNGISGMGTNVHALLLDTMQQQIWIGTRFEGIYRYDLRHHTSRHYLHSNGLTSEGCFYLARQRNGQLWVATLHGLLRYDPHTDTFLPVQHPTLSSCFIYTLCVDAADNLWVGTTNHGLFHIDTSTGHIRAFTQTDGSGLRDNYILCLHQDSHRRLWVGTNNGGLQYLEAQLDTLGSVTAAVLTQSTICSMEEADGNLWVSTSQGLFRYDLSTAAIERYTAESSGLPSNQFNYSSSLRTADGQLFYGTINGLIMFHPGELQTQHGTCSVHLQQLIINNDIITANAPDSPLRQHIDAATRLVLSHEQASHFIIQYGVIQPAGPAGVRYQVWLEGAERTWRDAGAERRFVGYKIPAGTYHLHLRATAAGGSWADSPVRTLELVVRPPWWRSPWAMLLYLLLAATLALSAWHFTQVRLRDRNAVRLAQMEREQIRQLDKAKSDFFTTAAHELKTPLTLILAPLHSIDPDSLDATGQQHLSTALASAGKLQQLIGQLVTFNKVESGDFPFYLRHGNPLHYITLLTAPFSEACRRQQLTLQVNTEDNGEEVWYSPSHLERILNNLMSNAIKFTPAGGTITVNASISPRDDSPYTFLLLEVSDTGIGIAPEEQQNIFQRFYQTKRGWASDQSGWGIGLALVKRLTDMLQGEVTVQSTMGRGTTFTVWLCASAEAFPEKCLLKTKDEETLQPPSTLQPQPLASPCKGGEPSPLTAENDAETNPATAPLLLLVDDNTDLLRFLSQTFSHNHRLITASSGAEALELARQQDPQMVISDVMMPGMDGYELCRRLKTDIATSHIPVILLTARSEQQDIVEGYQSGADAYVPKPFDPHVLQLQVSNILALVRRRAQYIAEADITTLEDPQDSTDINTLTELDRRFVERMTAVVEKNLDNSDFGIADITAELGISRSLLHLKMKNILGMSMGDYIRQKRLDLACHMLQQGYNVSETAYATGFSDPNYFSKTFKKHIGVNPKDYSSKA